MMRAIEALVEIFSWVGLGSGLLLAALALVLLLADGTWVPVRAVVEDLGDHRAVRWFDDDGEINESRLSEAQEREIGGHDMADIYVRRGSRDRMRTTRHDPVVRGVTLLSVGMLTVGMLALAASLIMLFVEG